MKRFELLAITPAPLQHRPMFSAAKRHRSDALTGVNDADYQPPSNFTGKLNRITLNIDRPQLTPADIQNLKEAQASAAKVAKLTTSVQEVQS